MEPLVLVVVVIAAVLHAGWNALVKIGGDALVRLGLVNATACLFALPLLPLVGLPAAESWPYLLGSILIHQFYNMFLVLSYRTGDLSHVYPIARGVAPLLVAIGAFALAGETLDSQGMTAVAIICAAILSLAFNGGWRHGVGKPLLYALCTGVSIAAYTVCDGLGGRTSGNVFGYIVCLFILDGIPITLLAVYLRRSVLSKSLRESWRPGMLGGAFAIVAYGLVIWAMSVSPLTYVSALRETSVVIAALIGTRLLKEPFGPGRVAAAGLVAGGVIMLQFSKSG